MRDNVPKSVQERLARREANGSLRSLPTIDGLIDFCSNDYLGFSRLKLAASTSPHGATGSRLISGNSTYHQALEQKLSNIHDAPEALLFNSGYDANLGVFSCIATRQDTIIFDELVHASIRDGIRLSLARSMHFKHNDLEDLASKLEKAKGEIFVAIESLYSMDGDIAPLAEILALCQRHKAHLILDEAHATGVIGEKGLGLAQSLGVHQEILLRVHTFGKAIGSHGAVVLSSPPMKHFLVNYARSLIYTTALPSSLLEHIAIAYDEMQKGEEIKRLQENINFFLEYFPSKNKKYITPIQSIIIPNNEAVIKAATHLKSLGFAVLPIRYPTVPKGSERLRICLHSFNTKTEISNLIHHLQEVS